MANLDPAMRAALAELAKRDEWETSHLPDTVDAATLVRLDEAGYVLAAFMVARSVDDGPGTTARLERHYGTLDGLGLPGIVWYSPTRVANMGVPDPHRVDGWFAMRAHKPRSKQDLRFVLRLTDTGRAAAAGGGGADPAGGQPTGEQPDDETPSPALTDNQSRVLKVMLGFGASRLLSADAIEKAMPAAERLSARTIGPAVVKLIALGLAERPEGKRSGARLTIKGRRLAPKIAP